MSRAQRQQEAIDRQAVEQAGQVYRAHRRDHGCREGGCPEASELAKATIEAQKTWGTRRFLAQDEGTGTEWTFRR